MQDFALQQRNTVGEDALGDAFVWCRSNFLIRHNVVGTAVCAWTGGNPH